MATIPKMKGRMSMKKYVSIAITLAILFSAMILPMQASAAETLKSGKTVYDSVDGKHSMEYNFTSAKEGKLTIDINPTGGDNTIFGGDIYIYVYDANGKAITASKSVNTQNGNKVERDKKGQLIYNIKKGAYKVFIKTITAYDTASYDMTVTFPAAAGESKDDASKSTSSSIMGVSLKKGSSLQLVGASSSDVTWKTSDKSVATVSSSGKVTAVAKGSATITATSGKTSQKIKIIVS